MSNNYWGAITWKFLHTISEKIKEEEFQGQKSKLLDLIKKICSNLPCPECKQHAVQYMKRVNINNISTKEDLINILFNFHNEVNKNIKKKIENKDILENYKENNTIEVLKTFIRIFSRPMINSRLMMESLNRNFLMKELLQYFKENIDKFDK